MSHVLVEYSDDKSLSVQPVSDLVVQVTGDKTALPALNEECVVYWKSAAKKKPAKYAAKVLLYNGKYAYFILANLQAACYTGDRFIKKNGLIRTQEGAFLNTAYSHSGV